MSKLVRFPLRSDKTPAVPKCTHWKNYTGEVKTPMVGIVVPESVFIIDIDTYKGVTRDAVESTLNCKLNWDESFLQTTLKGGEHHAFKVNPLEKLKQGSDLFELEGFDTRAPLRGYIATGEGYTDETIIGLEETLSDLELPSLPSAAVERLRESAKSEDEESDFLSLVAAETLELDQDELFHYVDLIPNSYAENQSDWLKVGMAIYHQTKGSDLGWELFDKFSSKCPEKYDQEANKKRWTSFDSSSRSNPVTFATVIKLAGGFEAKKEVTTKVITKNIEAAENLDDIKAELQRLASVKLDNLTLDVSLKSIQVKYKEIMGKAPSISAIKKEIKALKGDDNTGDYIEDYVFLTATGEYCHRETKALMGPRSFDVKHNRDTPTIDGEKQTACNYSNDKIDVVENTMYFPAAGEVFTHSGLDYLNAYEPNNLKQIKGERGGIVDRIKGHIAHLLPDEREQWIVINYLAHNVQRPGEKIQWAPVLQGVQGDGKSLLAEMMTLVLGYRNVRLMNVQTLESSFTGWATGQCMTFIEELKLDNFRKYEVLNNLKPYISNPVVEETKKGKDPRTVVNTTNYFALTNFKDAIPIDGNDRRYCILFSQWQRKDDLAEWMNKNPNYYPELYEAMRESPGEILYWLNNHEIDAEFLSMKRAPDTAAKLQMQELSKPTSTLDLEDALDKFKASCMISDNEIDITQLQKLVKEEQVFGSFEDFPQTKSLKNSLMSMGFEQKGRMRTKFSEGGNKHMVYEI